MNKLTAEQRILIQLRVDIDEAIKNIQRLVNDKLLSTIEKKQKDEIRNICFHDFTKKAY